MNFCVVFVSQVTEHEKSLQKFENSEQISGQNSGRNSNSGNFRSATFLASLNLNLKISKISVQNPPGKIGPCRGRTILRGYRGLFGADRDQFLRTSQPWRSAEIACEGAFLPYLVHVWAKPQFANSLAPPMACHIFDFPFLLI